MAPTSCSGPSKMLGAALVVAALFVGPPGHSVSGQGGDWYSPRGPYGPTGHFGPWPTCGCSSLLIILAGILLVCAGGMNLFHQ